MFYFFNEVLTFVVRKFPFRNSRISICVLDDRSASLNFCVESFSQQNCLGKCFKVSSACATFLLQIFVSMFSQTITGL